MSFAPLLYNFIVYPNPNPNPNIIPLGNKTKNNGEQNGIGIWNLESGVWLDVNFRYFGYNVYNPVKDQTEIENDNDNDNGSKKDDEVEDVIKKWYSLQKSRKRQPFGVGKIKYIECAYDFHIVNINVSFIFSAIDIDILAVPVFLLLSLTTS